MRAMTAQSEKPSRKALVDDRPALLATARSSGIVAAENLATRAAPFHDPVLNEAWISGYDAQIGRRRVRSDDSPPPEPRVADQPIDPRCAHARAVHRAARRSRP